MNRITRFYKIAAIMTAILMLFSCTACASKKKPQAKSSSQQEEKEPPKELDKLKKSIDKIEKKLTAIYEDNKKPLFMQEQSIQSQNKKQQGGSKDSSSGGDGQSTKSGSSGSGSSSGSSGGGNSGGQQPQTQQLSAELMKEKLLQDKYKKLDDMKKDVIELHTAWNSYEPKAIADFVQQDVITEYEAALNRLTDAINKHDVYATMLEINQLNKYMPDFYSLYKTKYPPDIDRIRFAVTKIKLVTDNKDYEGANSVLAYLDTVWAAAKPKLKKDNLEQINKFDLALADLKAALETKNDTIIEAKTEVIKKIMDEIEKAAKKGSK